MPARKVPAISAHSGKHHEVAEPRKIALLSGKAAMETRLLVAWIEVPNEALLADWQLAESMRITNIKAESDRTLRITAKRRIGSLDNPFLEYGVFAPLQDQTTC